MTGRVEAIAVAVVRTDPLTRVKSGRPGCYLAVESAGAVRAGDPATVVHRPGHGVTVVDLMAAMTGERAVLPRVRTARPDLGVRGREWLAGAGG